jgi:hypothetical protein
MKNALSISKDLDFRLALMFLLTLALSFFLIYRIRIGVDIADLWKVLAQLNSSNIIGLSLAVLLLIPNWLLEAIKLRYLLHQHRPVALGSCLSSVLTGVTLGLVTPARLGEYGGRILAFDQQRRSEVLGSTLITSLCQMAISLLLGAVSAVILLRAHQWISNKWVLAGAILGIMLMIAAMAYLPTILGYATQLPWSKPKDISKGWLDGITRKGIATVLGFSTLRYIVYTVQFLLVLVVLGAGVPIGTLLLHIPLIFLLQTLMPLPPIASLLGRAGAAVIVLSPLGLSDVHILTASALIWVINLVFPAFVGLGLIWKLVSHRGK